MSYGNNFHRRDTRNNWKHKSHNYDSEKRKQRRSTQWGWGSLCD